MKTQRRVLNFAAMLLTLASGAQASRAPQPPQVFASYTIHVDRRDLSDFNVELRVRHAGPDLRVAMASHPEYDDRYWRYVENVTAESIGTSIKVVREEDALWRIDNAGPDVTIRYRIHLPPETSPRAAWHPFLSDSGGLVGDLHSLMYVVGAENQPALVTLELPKDWAIASGLNRTADPRTFSASSVELLLDSPILIGHFQSWDFHAGRVPHHLIYFPRADATDFDRLGFVNGVKKLANEAFMIFRKAPYRSYSFIYEDGADGALEHLNSVTIGAQSRELAKGLDSVFQVTSHEYFHTWNLMHVRPRERVGLRYHHAQPTSVLWWSEGVTIFFSDLLLRRARLPVFESTRTEHLANKIATYLLTPGYSRISPERVSLASDDPNGLGDDYASIYLQGELLGAMLDLLIREATHGGRSLDDAMRRLSDHFTPQRGIGDRDIEKAIHEVCQCDVHAFFRLYVQSAHQLDFDRFLKPIGLHTNISWGPARNNDGTLAPDLRVVAFTAVNDPALRLRLLNPSSAWGRAGLHTGDRLVSVDGRPLRSWNELRSWLGQLRLGQTAHLEVMRNGSTLPISVPITGYDRPTVKIEEIANATPEQRRLRAQWANADRAK